MSRTDGTYPDAAPDTQPKPWTIDHDRACSCCKERASTVVLGYIETPVWAGILVLCPACIDDASLTMSVELSEQQESAEALTRTEGDDPT